MAFKEIGEKKRDPRDAVNRVTPPKRLSVWHIIGGLAVVGVAAIVITALPDIKRYVRISTM